MSIEVMKQARSHLQFAKYCGHFAAFNPATLDETLAQLDAAIEQMEKQEPVAFLANGTRFKISYDTRQSGGQIRGIPPELSGRWVAFVAAEDDCHLKLTTPPAALVQEPYTYASTQATKCACCGEHKHTPLRIDAMGGYVCLTCIDQKLGSLLGEFGYLPSAPVREPVWRTNGGIPRFKDKAAAQRQPLTDEQIRQVMRPLGWDRVTTSDFAFVRAIEQAHGITGEKK